MISRSTLSNKPFLLKPAAKDSLWGGNRLNDDFEKNIKMTPLAETWECSVHPDGPSVVASGMYQGMTLDQVLQLNPEWIGRERKALPILVKFIDAKKDLSVQVHPSDEYAMEHENGQLGKTEMWYILDATSDASIIYGLNRDVQQDDLRNAIQDGSLERLMQKIPVKKDQLFFIDPGTIHAIGAGCLIAEIQESSNLTYRLYDYNRVGKDGKTRELHVDKALAVANLKSSKSPRQPMRTLRHKLGCASELLSRCKYFEVYRMLLNTERCRTLVDYQTRDSFQVLLCVDGCGSFSVDGQVTNFFKGDCIFFPAQSACVKLHGRAQLLDIRG